LDPGADFHSGNFPIESIRATHLAGEPRERRFCSDCRPDLCDEDGLDMILVYDIIDEHHHSAGWCSCTLALEFIEDSWLCIPCFIKQEAKAYSRRLKKEVFKLETSQDGSRKLVGTTVCSMPLL
jgi:hypothetical protein